MVNIYKLTNLLEAGMTIFQLNQWKEEGIWYPITQYKKPSNEIKVVTNLFVPDAKKFHVQLSANYDPEEIQAWDELLEKNQWKLYPLLRDLMNIFLPSPESEYQFFYTKFSKGFISVIAQPI